MIRKTVLASATAALLVGCGGGGDINLSPTNIDNSVDNSTTTGGGGSTNPCAQFTDAATGNTVQGAFDGQNCTYSSDFVGVGNPLTVDLTIPFISGVHIFEDSLFVGENVDTGAAPQEGEGPTLTIRPGNTLAFLDSQDYILINRGSQIIANGSVSAPITLTAFSDAVLGTAGPEDVSLWGGVQINGNGITNNCTDDERTNNACHVLTEGQPSNYGGNNNAESSGSLQFVVVKHSGFEVAPGDELNGVTFNAVGSGTTVRNAEVYSTFDDGFEFFGGAVAVERFIALYVRDDSIDYSDGWVGSMSEALVIHQLTDGNRCIEGDNIGAGRSDNGESLNTMPLTNPMISNLTCIPSANDDGTHGDSEGILLRQGARSQVADSIVFGAYGEVANATASNECLELDETETRDAAQAGETTFTTSLLACQTPTQDSLSNGDTVAEYFLNASSNGADYSFNVADMRPNVIISDSTNANISVLEMGSFRTAGYDPDADTTTFTQADGSTVTFPGRIGAVTADDDWTQGWTFGLNATNRAQPLYFE